MRRLILSVLLSSCTAYGGAILVTNPNQIYSTDVLNWSQLGADKTSVWSNFFAYTSSVDPSSSFVDTVSGRLTSGNGRVMQAGVDWTASGGIQANDALLQTSSTGTNGTGPLTLSMSGSYGVGAYIDSDGVGAFTARIQAFSGLNSVLDTTVTSSNGDAIFLGVLDTKADITRVVYSLMSAPVGFSTGDFVMDKILFQNSASAPLSSPPITAPSSAPLAPISTAADPAPEPGSIGLMIIGCVALGFKFRKRLRLI